MNRISTEKKVAVISALVEGISVPQKRSDRVVLEANMDYWDTTRLPRLQRIVFDNTITQKDAVELVKTVE